MRRGAPRRGKDEERGDKHWNVTSSPEQVDDDGGNRSSGDRLLRPGGTEERENTGKWRRGHWAFIERRKEGDRAFIRRKSRDFTFQTRQRDLRREEEDEVTSRLRHAVADRWDPPVSGCGEKLARAGRSSRAWGLLGWPSWAGSAGSPIFLSKTNFSLFQNIKPRQLLFKNSK